MNFRWPLFFFLLANGVARAGDVSSLIQTGDTLDRQLKTEAALQTYLQAAQASPCDANVLYRVACEYGLSMDDVSDDASKRDRGEKALDYAQRAVAVDPHNEKAQLALAISYGRVAGFLDNKTKLNYARQVKTHADLALSLDPHDDLTYHVLGSWNYELANLNPVLRMLAGAIYGTLPAASNEEAVRDFKAAIALKPDRLANYVELGRVYAATGDTALARQQLTRALSMPNREKDDPLEKRIANETLQSL
jgi:tetratricopeptide (TPR) repeat protein